MSNPKPTLMSINAFDVNATTNIQFYISGQTELVSNIYFKVYQTSDNDLLFTYTTTEYNLTDGIFEITLPIIHTASTPSGVTWSGEHTYQDFVNGKTYYATISVEDNASLYSNSVIFNCITTPSLTWGTITTPLTSTSVHLEVSVNLNQTTIQNYVQSYSFYLVDNETGNRIQYSGEIFGSGIQSTTDDTTYIFSYNFYNLENAVVYKAYFEYETINNMTGNSTSTTFQTSYSFQYDGDITLTNRCGNDDTNKDGCVTVDIDGQVTGSSIIGNTKLVIKRKASDDKKDRWVSIYKTKEQTSSHAYEFSFDDYGVKTGVTYTYKAIPIIEQTDILGNTIEIEGTTEILETITPSFDGIYIANDGYVLKLYSGVAYSDEVKNIEVSSQTTLGSKYPSTISNSEIKYSSGTISGNLLPENYMSTRNVTSFVNRKNIVDIHNDVLDWLTDGTIKIIKDWNGNMWMVSIPDSPSVSFDSNTSLIFMTLSANWDEVGDMYDSDDLADAGLTNIKEM